ncbi:MAG: hypothetical protein IJL26_12380 [Clostridia bacterium]|nr:hypothetical protein [Clostridia bacterium]
MRNAEKKKRTMLPDFCAVAVFCALFGWFAYSVRFGVNRVDESFYLSIVQRFLQGDRVLVDEWHLSQLSALFQALPYAVYVRAAGGTQGVILYMRYVFLAVHALLYWYLYGKLRSRGLSGLVSAALFFAFVPFALFTLSYYTMATHALLVVCVLLFLKEKPSAPALVLAGTVFSCAVLIEPPFAFIYFLYTVLVLVYAVSKKRGKLFFPSYDFILCGRVWKYLTLGVVISAAAFLIFLQCNAGLGSVIKNLPNLFTDSEYDLSAGGVVSGYFPRKLARAAELFGVPFCAGLLFSLAAAIFCSFYKKKKPVFGGTAARVAVFALAALCAGGAAVYAFFKRGAGDVNQPWFYFSALTLPAAVFGAVCHFLLKKKDRRLFCFFIVGFFASVAKDAVSEVSLGVACALGFIPAAIFAFSLGKELRDEEKRIAGGRRVAARAALFAAAAGLCCVLTAHGCAAYLSGSFKLMEQFYAPMYSGISAENTPLDSKIEKGPYRGVYTTALFKMRHEAMLSDLDKIAGSAQGGVYVTERFPAAYLYLDRPYGAYSTWFVEKDGERQREYWRLHPEKYPVFVYVPFYHGSFYVSNERVQGEGWTDRALESARALGGGEPVRGKAGYIVRIGETEKN